MNQAQFEPVLTRTGTLVLKFSGRSTVRDTPAIFAQIHHAIERAKKAKNLVFDLTRIDVVNNIAGRMLDMAKLCAKNQNVAVEFKIPENVYPGLQELTPDKLPKRPTARLVDGLKITLTKPADEFEPGVDSPPQSTLDIPVPPETVLFSCLGKIRSVEGDVIVISLFTDEGEVVAKLGRRQFPHMELKKGKMFKYKAIVTNPGQTTVVIENLAERKLGSDEILEIWDETDSAIPADEF